MIKLRRNALGQPVITPIGDDSRCIVQIQEHIQFGRGFFPGVASFNMTGTWNDATLATLDNVFGSRDAWRKIGNACQVKDALLAGYAPNVSQGERGHIAQPVPVEKRSSSTSPSSVSPPLVSGIKPEQIGIALLVGVLAYSLWDKRRAQTT